MAKAIVEIGEMVISLGDKDYFFKPSFRNLYNIGDPEELVRIWSLLNWLHVPVQVLEGKKAHVQRDLLKLFNSPVFGRSTLLAACTVLGGCCEEDITPLVGEWVAGKNGMLWRKGALPAGDIIVLANRLMQHGIIGCCEINLPSDYKPKKTDYAAKFNPLEYISLARTWLGMSKEQAEDLTLTEMLYLMKAQMPEKKSGEVFTEEEYDSIMDAYYAEREAALKGEINNGG